MQLNTRLIMSAIAVFALIVCSGGFVVGEPVRLEAEGGTFSGQLVKISSAVAGYSGDGYLTDFRSGSEDGGLALVAVYAPADGDYPLAIGYRSHHSNKRNRLSVNDEDLGHVIYPMSAVFTELQYGDIELNAGTNTIMFHVFPGGDGWMDLDYFEVDGLSPQAMEPSPRHVSTVFPTVHQLSWKNPDPGPGDIITCDVYIGTAEPDELLADYGMTKIASGMWGDSVEIPFALSAMQDYYWVVDCWDYNAGSPVLLRGPTWRFTTSDPPTVIEAEDGWITGPVMRVSADVPGYSGTGYVTGFNQIDRPNEKVTVSVFAAEAGDYPLSIGFHSPYGNKTQYLYVNDVQKAHAYFFLTDSWDVLNYGTVSLNEGMNTITVATWYGYFFLDYFAINGLAPAASSPKPAHLATAGTNLAQLCWNKPPGSAITCDVYFGDAPNELLPNYGLPLIAEGISGNCADVSGPLVLGHDYYWLVNCWDNAGETPELMPGGLWTFETGNTPPVIDMGPNHHVWLGKDGTPGQVTATISPTVTDDGFPSGTLTYEWVQIPDYGPAVAISPNDQKDISLTFTETALYGFHLTVSDSEFTVSGTVWVSVQETPCEAAQAASAYQPLAGDLDGNCYVDLNDFVILAMNWLNCVDPEGCQ